ncbi:MAG: imidazole glycerol phosphate synthase subunit HisH [Pseudomonadota bacterium]
MIGVVDYGMGNLLSVCNALEMIGAQVTIITRPEDLQDVERIVLPGVGAFHDCMRNLEDKGFREALDEAVLREEKPILGICLGMQVMARKGYEGHESEGLGWFDAEVVSLRSLDSSIRIPQVGWNDVSLKEGSPLFQGLPRSPDLYFVHSYFMKCTSEDDVLGTCNYGGLVTAVVGRKNIFGMQFHPEKSQEYGLKLLQNFIDWKS